MAGYITPPFKYGSDTKDPRPRSHLNYNLIRNFNEAQAPWLKETDLQEREEIAPPERDRGGQTFAEVQGLPQEGLPVEKAERVSAEKKDGN